jgi:zinc/manganese transport system substrate-binding protein
MGDLHGGGNPHYSYDPRRMIAVAHGVAKRFADIDPANTQDYLDNAATFEAEVQTAVARWTQQLAHLQDAKVIQYHRSWVYVADWLGLQLLTEVEPKPGIPPAPAQVARVVRLAQQQGVKIVLIESFYPQNTAQLVADKSGAALVTLQAGTSFAAGQTYIQHIDSWVTKLVAASR